MEAQMWTGPSLMNPRNVKGEERKTYIGAQYGDVRAALHGHAAHRLGAIAIRAGNHRIIAHGRVEEVVETGDQIRFALWEPAELGSRQWRVCHLVDAKLSDGDMTVTTIRVAPDDPNDDTVHAPSPA